MLHIVESLAEQCYLIVPLYDRNSLGKVSPCYDVGRMCKMFKRFHTTADKDDADHHHDQDSYCRHDDKRPFHGVQPPIYILFRANNSHTPPHLLERSVEYVRITLASRDISRQSHHASTAISHPFSERLYILYAGIQVSGKDRITAENSRVGMHEIDPSPAESYGIRVRIRLQVADNLRQPFLVNVDGQHSHRLSVVIMNGKSIGTNLFYLHPSSLFVLIDVTVRVSPIWLIEEFRYLIPVHVEIFIQGTALLFYSNAAVRLPSCVCREVMSLLFHEEIRLKRNGAALHVRIILHHHSRQGKHLIGVTYILLDERHQVACTHFYGRCDIVYSEDGVIQFCHSHLLSLLLDSLLRMIEVGGVADDEDQRSDKSGKDAQFGRKRLFEFFHIIPLVELFRNVLVVQFMPYQIVFPQHVNRLVCDIPIQHERRLASLGVGVES